MKRQYVFDFRRAAIEVYGIIHLIQPIYSYPIPVDERKVEVLTEIIYLLFKTEIEDRIHPHIRNKYWGNLLDTLLLELTVSPDSLKKTIMEMLFFKEYIRIIHVEIPENSYDIWGLNKITAYYLFEYIGDYRIIEWESDHVRNGRYVSKSK